MEAARKAYESTGALPLKALKTLKGKPSSSTLETAFLKAAGEYYKAKKDGEAHVVEKELEAFKNGIITTPQLSIFNGKDLDGWQGLTENWTVNQGAIVGTCKPGELKENSCLVYKTEVGDFELRCKVKLSVNPPINSGIQFRSKYKESKLFHLNGPQCDFGDGVTWGSLYDEGTGMIQEANKASVERVFKPGAFNDVFLRCVGNRVHARAVYSWHTACHDVSWYRANSKTDESVLCTSNSVTNTKWSDCGAAIQSKSMVD